MTIDTLKQILETRAAALEGIESEYYEGLLAGYEEVIKLIEKDSSIKVIKLSYADYLNKKILEEHGASPSEIAEIFQS